MIYELILILKYLNFNIVNKNISIIKKILLYNYCIIIKLEYWGVLNFSYNIENKKYGYYIFLKIEIFKNLINKIKFFLKFNNSIIRFLILKLNKEDFNVNNDFILKKIFLKKDNLYKNYFL